jgi:carboxyl-terminal processing protease
MPRFNSYVILFALLVYALTAGITLRDRLLISTLHHFERNAYFEPSAKDLFEGAMRGMTKILADEYGDYYSLYIPSSGQNKFQDDYFNRFEGLGFSMRLHEAGEEKKLLINYPYRESPAYRAGLRSGDQILQIDGVPIENMTRYEMYNLTWEQETRLSMLPFGQTESKDFFVRREKIQSDSVEGDYFDSDKRIFCLEAHPMIGYIRITSFGGATTSKEFGTALNSMKQSGVESFILDLRDNGGGDVRECIQIAQMLMSPDPVSGDVIVTQRLRNSSRRHSFTLTAGSQCCTLPMVVLINGETASASEFLAAALQDHRRATIVGTRSFGKGIGQGITDLPFQSGMLQLTDLEYRRPNGAAIHRKKDAADSDDWGVIPDNIVAIDEAEWWLAVGLYRSMRSNVVFQQRLAVLEQFRQQITDSQDGKFEFTGTAPYYDVQIDEAIKILTNTP